MKLLHWMTVQWKRVSCKQSTIWQHLSRLKASALFFLQKNVSCMKQNKLYLELVTPSCGWWSPIGNPYFLAKCFTINEEQKTFFMYNSSLVDVKENNWKETTIPLKSLLIHITSSYETTWLNDLIIENLKFLAKFFTIYEEQRVKSLNFFPIWFIACWCSKEWKGKKALISLMSL